MEEYVPPKRRSLSELHGVIIQKTALFSFVYDFVGSIKALYNLQGEYATRI
jgi:hypothetical protein